MDHKLDTKGCKSCARSRHHLKETQALLSNLPDHGSHEGYYKKHYKESRSNEMDIEMGVRA